MDIEEIQRICRSFPGVTEDIKWEDHLCFNVGGKMFLITSPDQVPCTASFKVKDEDFETMSARDGLMPAPYLARYKWIFADDINRLSRKEWQAVLATSYNLVASRLPARIRKSIGWVG